MNVVTVISNAVERSETHGDLVDARSRESLRLAVAIAAYIAAFLFLSAIGLIAAGYHQPDLLAVPDPQGLTYPVSLLTLVGAALLCGALWVYGTVWLRAALITRTSLLAATVIGLSYLSALAALWATWSFNLDDKYIFMRTTRNLVRYGLPYWNPGERVNVQTSFIWPYLTAPGVWFGDWDLFARIVGIASFVLTSVVIALQVRDVLLRAVAAAAVILFLPLLLWSQGALETSFATLVLIATACYAFRRGIASPLVWLLFGSMAFIRPDVVLVGVGVGAVYGLFGGGVLRRRILMGFLLIAPVLAFIVMNIALFDFPFPRPFYIKGWNKSFSGSYPLYYDIYIGMSHLVSALSLSVVWVTLLGVFGWRIARKGRGTWRLDELALAAGALVHLAYVVVGGYQHMNYTFRYYIPSMVLLLFVAIIHVDRAIAAGALRPRALLMSALVWGSLFVQIPFFAWTTYHANWHEMALTFSPLRDRFSVHSYAAYMDTWLEAGEYLKRIERPGDRVFQWRDIAGSAMTDMYVMDQYYAPPTLSSHPDIRGCTASLSCVRLYDYLMTGAEPNVARTLPTHLVVQRYHNLWIMKRATRVVDDLPAATAPASAATVRLADVQVSGERAETVDGGTGLRLAASTSAAPVLTLQLDGVNDLSTVIVVATTRVGTPGTPLALQLAGDSRPADVLPFDELVGDGAWTRMAVAVEDGHWQNGVASIALRTVAEAGASFEVSEIRVIVDGQTALTLAGQQLATLAR
jgi:hypothetical protein